MASLLSPQSHQLRLVTGERAMTEKMLKLIAALAVHGKVTVLDGGNRFDAYVVTRLIRRRTIHLDEALARIRVARAFMCHQMATLLGQTPASAHPVLVLDLLATFFDEAVEEAESLRLLRICIKHLQRLRLYAPVVVSVTPVRSPTEGLHPLHAALLETADAQSYAELPQPPAVPYRLF